MYTSILAVLSEAVGTDLEFNALGFCSIPVEAGMMLRVLERPAFETNRIILEIAQVPADQYDTVTALLNDVAASGVAGDIVLGLEREAGMVAASCEVPREAEVAVFEETLARLLPFADRWRQALAELTTGGETVQDDRTASESESESFPASAFISMSVRPGDHRYA